MIRRTNDNDNRREVVYRLAADTALGPRTVARVLSGASVRASTRRAVEEAARRLRIELPAGAA